MADWGFYGRQDELEAVERFIERPGFDAGRVTGGRRIGKTKLMQQIRKRTDNNPPMLIFELKDPKYENQERANRRLIREARLAFGKPVKIPRRTAYFAGDPQEYFTSIIRELLAQGAVICLDEFQMAKDMGLEGGLKKLIDDSGPLADNPPGKLIMMGSHQQQVQEMFTCKKPLHGRAGRIVQLMQWPPPTLFEMAREQGFLQYPGRLLTLWTAFGGVPGNWERFAREEADNLARMGDWDNDDAWREAFLGWHRQLLADPEERFDSKAYVELAEPAREALLALAQNPDGMTLSEFPPGPGGKPDDGLPKLLIKLRDHLGMVENHDPFMSEAMLKWRIADNSTLCQLHVHPELFQEERSGRVTPPDPSRRTPLERLETLEGHALERMAAACLGGQPGVTWSEHAVWRNRRDGTSMPDIDVMGFRGWWTEPDAVLMMGSCKRRARTHTARKVDEQFESFLAEVADDDTDFRLMAREKLLISPEFTSDQRQHYARDGFEAVGIQDMAATDLHEAARANDTARIAELIAAGADVGAVGLFDRTPLHHAATSRGVEEAAGALAELGGDLQAGDRDDNTPLHLAALSNDDPDMAAHLTRLGAEVNARNSAGMTPLHLAAWPTADGRMADRLIELGADLHARDHEGRTPLHLARQYRKTAMIQAIRTATGQTPDRSRPPPAPPAEPDNDSSSTPSM